MSTSAKSITDWLCALEDERDHWQKQFYDCNKEFVRVVEERNTLREQREQLVAEARLQGELQARSFYSAAARTEGRSLERAAVLAWLRAVEDEGRGSTWQWADAIERGEHIVK